jgi:putative endonuclease
LSKGPRTTPPELYLLRCADDSFYVGSTRELDQRVAEHASGAVRGYTSTRLPVELVWALETERMDDAAELERQIKGWRRSKRLALIEGRLDDLPALSRPGPHTGC